MCFSFQDVALQLTNITSAKVGWFVSRITQQLLNEFPLNLDEGSVSMQDLFIFFSLLLTLQDKTHFP